jgi:hypothetical protein
MEKHWRLWVRLRFLWQQEDVTVRSKGLKVNAEHSTISIQRFFFFKKRKSLRHASQASFLFGV